MFIPYFDEINLNKSGKMNKIQPGPITKSRAPSLNIGALGTISTFKTSNRQDIKCMFQAKLIQGWDKTQNQTQIDWTSKQQNAQHLVFGDFCKNFGDLCKIFGDFCKIFAKFCIFNNPICMILWVWSSQLFYNINET